MENKETFEEAVVNSWLDYEHVEGHLYSTTYRAGFEAGAKWQAERMGYLIEALKVIESVIDNDNPSHEDIWRIANGAIEQFNKSKQ